LDLKEEESRKVMKIIKKKVCRQGQWSETAREAKLNA
jgi:hypothetical protein